MPLLDWRDAELSRLRMQVEQMRIDAIKDREAFAAKLVIEANTLRADLAEARADVARFEAALDVANRELAEARATISVRNALHDEIIDNLQNMAASVRDAEAERDDADDDLSKALAMLDKKDATIRALVVAARAIHRTLWSALDQYEVNNEGIEREMRQHVIGLRWEMQQAERGQAGKSKEQ